MVTLSSRTVSEGLPLDDLHHPSNNKYHIAGNFCQEKIFTNFATCSRWRNNFICEFFVLYMCVNNYIEDIATFTALAKIYSAECFWNTKVAVLGEIFVQRKFSAIRYKKH